MIEATLNEQIEKIFKQTLTDNFDYLVLQLNNRLKIGSTSVVDDTYHIEIAEQTIRLSCRDFYNICAYHFRNAVKAAFDKTEFNKTGKTYILGWFKRIDTYDRYKKFPYERRIIAASKEKCGYNVVIEVDGYLNLNDLPNRNRYFEYTHLSYSVEQIMFTLSGNKEFDSLFRSLKRTQGIDAVLSD